MLKGDEPITKYAITTTKTELKMHFSKEAPIEGPENMRDNRLTVDAGTLLKVFQTNTAGVAKFNTVQVLDYQRRNAIFEHSLFECSQAHMRKVSEDLWPYVIAISDAGRRLSFVQEQEQNRWVIYLKKNDFVNVGGEFFGRDSSVRYDCIIRYIGPVEEISPVGYCFGLELLNLDHGSSPQEEDIPFSSTYMNTDPSLSIFTTADRLSQISSESKKKFSAIDLFNGAVEKVRSAIAPNICLSSPPNTRTSSLTREKKTKKKAPTSYFYDTPITPSALRDEPAYLDVIDKSTTKSPLSTMERRTQSQHKQPPQTSSTVDTEPIISLDSDDFKQSIENHEKNIERRLASNSNSHSHSNSNDSTHIPSATQPTGILKHRRTPSTGGGGGSGGKDENASSSKPLTILSLEDRDIVVIDKADIRESTKNEGSVVVVDKQRAQQDVDLAELLGSNWPNTAGDAANILNKPLKPLSATTSSEHGTLTKGERVKSANPLSHFGGTRGSQERGHRTGDKTSQTLLEASGGTGSGAKKRKFTTQRKRDVPSYINLLDADNFDAAELPATIAPPPDVDFVQSSPLQEVPECTGLGVGSMVEVRVPESADDLYGVIRWIGVPPTANSVMVGIELEDDNTNKQLLTTDGTFNGFPLFKCHEGRALFVTPNQCARDKRFLDVEGGAEAIGKMTNNHIDHQNDSKMFGQVECPSVPGAIAPLRILNLDGLEEMCGKFKGIQGHHNSCYLDATLFSMFAFTSVFDSLLFRPPEPEDISHYVEVQKVLREEIVNPLRKNMFVRADRVMKLRQLLDKLSSVSGLMSEEKDPEEFINSLLAQIMRVEPFLKLSSGQDAYFYQLFVEKDERLSFPTVQQLFEQSFHSSDIKLKEVPSCLIIQMPRFGKNYKMYPRILPSQVLDVTDIIEDSPRQCSVCGKLAEFECRDCFGNIQGGAGLESTAFCAQCLQTVHMHAKRANHTSKKLSVPQDFRIMAEHMNVPRLYMELFAVVCIETSHYVAFVKAGCGQDAPWCFFDSMADRKGEQNGYNIPEMVTVPDMPLWLSEEGARTVNETSANDKMLPEHAKRLFCDAYMCMYQSTDVMMYR